MATKGGVQRIQDGVKIIQGEVVGTKYQITLVQDQVRLVLEKIYEYPEESLQNLFKVAQRFYQPLVSLPLHTPRPLTI